MEPPNVAVQALGCSAEREGRVACNRVLGGYPLTQDPEIDLAAALSLEPSML